MSGTSNMIEGPVAGATRLGERIANIDWLDLPELPAELQAPAVDLAEDELLARWGERIALTRPQGLSDYQYDRLEDRVLQELDIDSSVTWQSAHGVVLASGVRAGREWVIALHDGKIASHSREEWERRAQSLETPAEKQTSSRFRILSAQEFAGGEYVEPDWLIDELIPAQGVGLAWGQSGTLKTCFAWDLVRSVHLGQDWRGRKVQKAPGLFVVGEGEHFFSLRMRADAKAHGFEVGDLPHVLASPVNLFNAAEVAEFIEAARAIAPKFIAFDTLATCSLGADENSGKDMNVVYGAAKLISQTLKCFVLLISHSGKDESRGVRGSSIQKPAVDVEIHCEGNGETQNRATVEKLKDGPRGAVFAYAKKFVELGVSRKTGRAFGSVVVVPIEDAATRAATAKRKRPTKTPHIVLTCIEKHFPNGAHYLSDVFEVCKEDIQAAVKNPGRAREYFLDAVAKLADTDVNKWLYRHSNERISLHAVAPTSEGFALEDKPRQS